MSGPALKYNVYIYHAPMREAYDWAGDVTNQIVWTPVTGKAIVITDLYVSQETAGSFVIFEETNNLTNRIARDYFANVAGSNKPFAQRIELAIDNSIKITTSGGGTGSMMVLGFEQ